MDIAGLELSQQQKLLNQLYNLKIQARDKALAMEKRKAEEERKAIEQAHKEKISLLDRQQKEVVMKLINKRITENLTEQEYNRQLKDLFLTFLDEKLALEDLSEDERLDLQSQKQQIELDNYIEHATQLREQQEEYKAFIEDMSVALGETLGEMFMSNEEGMRDMLKNMLKMLLDYLEKVMLASIGQVTITAFTNFASAAAAMGKIIAIKAAFSAAKAAIGNFYTGGYTGQGSWDQPQGIVHSNEFVANRFAVANPAVRPVLDLLDQAQRSGSISNLTSADIAAVSGRSSSPNDVTIVNNPSSINAGIGDNRMMNVVIECTRVMKLIQERFKDDIKAEVSITGKRGLNNVSNTYDKLIKNIER